MAKTFKSSPSTLLMNSLMNILYQLITITAFTSVVISGCSLLSPSDQPFPAEEYMQQAEMSGAAEFAPEEYQRLLQEFSQLEKLHQAHQYDAVNKRLPNFAAEVEQLVELTRQNINKVEALTTPPETTAPTPTPPPPPVAPISPGSERSTTQRLNYTVRAGELLWAIAKRPDVYDDPFLWPLLYQANRDQIKDPRKIYAGQTLAIPRNVSEAEREEARQRAKKSDFFPQDELMRPLR